MSVSVSRRAGYVEGWLGGVYECLCELGEVYTLINVVEVERGGVIGGPVGASGYVSVVADTTRRGCTLFLKPRRVGAVRARLVFARGNPVASLVRRRVPALEVEYAGEGGGAGRLLIPLVPLDLVSAVNVLANWEFAFDVAEGLLPRGLLDSEAESLLGRVREAAERLSSTTEPPRVDVRVVRLRPPPNPLLRIVVDGAHISSVDVVYYTRRLLHGSSEYTEGLLEVYWRAGGGRETPLQLSLDTLRRFRYGSVWERGGVAEVLTRILGEEGVMELYTSLRRAATLARKALHLVAVVARH